MPDDVIGPDRLALVVTVPAVRFAAVPVAFVSTTLAGVPSAGLAPKLVRLDAVTPDASVVPVMLAAATLPAATAVLQENPVPLVHKRALADVLQDGTESATPAGVVDVIEPRSLFVPNGT